MRVSKYLSYKEATKSYTAAKRGINNTPSKEQLQRIINWGRYIFDPIRSFIGAPLGCRSIFRAPKLNKIIGGSDGSQHQALKGAAGDIDTDIYDNGTNEQVFNFVKDHLSFDQMIIEGLQDGGIQWVHISFVSYEENRNEILMMYVDESGTHYEHYSEERYKQLINKFKK